MSDILLRKWWLLGLRGAIAVLFGVTAISWPAITLLMLALLFAVFAMLAGAVWTWAALSGRSSDGRGGMLLLGLVSIVAGVLAALYPAITTLALVLVMGVNALVSGVIDIVVALRVRSYMHGEWLLGLSGAVACVFGLMVLSLPAGAGLLTLTFMTGAYAIVSGALLIMLAWQVRAWMRLHGGRSSPPAGAT